MQNNQSKMDPPPEFFQGLEKLSVSLTDTQLQQLSAYLQFLLETNKKFNLTAVDDPREAWIRHILDSLLLHPLLHRDATWIDLGSGGGLPGIPLAILRPETKWILVESKHKKCRFLEEVVRMLSLLNVTISCARIEDCARGPLREKADGVTGRAIAPLPRLLEYAHGLVRNQGLIAPIKGRDLPHELEEAKNALKSLPCELIKIMDPLSDGESLIPVFIKSGPTPALFPRPPAIIKKTPL